MFLRLGVHPKIDLLTIGEVSARDVATPSFYEVARASEVRTPALKCQSLKAHPVQVNVSVSFPGNLTTATIEPGDFIVGDLNGVVHIPTHLLPQIMDILPTIVSADELVAADIDRGVTFKEASNTHRKK